MKRKVLIVLALCLFFIPSSSFSANYGDLLRGEINRTVLNVMGSIAVKVAHPFKANHLSTSLIEKGDRTLKFVSNYKGFVNPHRMKWYIRLNSQGRIIDFGYLSDTNKFPGARIANRAKKKLIRAMKNYHRKRR